MARDQRRQHLVEEHRLAVEDVDLGIGDLAMDQQRHAGLLHRLEAAGDGVHRGDAVRRVGRGMGGIELGGDPHALVLAARQLGRIGAVGQVAGHQRLECELGRNRSANSVAIGGGLGDLRHRRHEVGHDDAAGELAGRVHGAGRQHRPVAQMDVPVVGAADRERRGLGHMRFYACSRTPSNVDCVHDRSQRGDRLRPVHRVQMGRGHEDARRAVRDDLRFRREGAGQRDAGPGGASRRPFRHRLSRRQAAGRMGRYQPRRHDLQRRQELPLPAGGPRGRRRADQEPRRQGGRLRAR